MGGIRWVNGCGMGLKLWVRRMTRGSAYEVMEVGGGEGMEGKRWFWREG